LDSNNRNAYNRAIYIHGTPEERLIGRPASYGCIRMRSQDILEVFEETAVDTPVSIIPEKFPHYAKYVQPKPKIIVSVPPPKPAPVASKLAPPAPTPAIASTTTAPSKKVASTAPTPAPIAEYHPSVVEHVTRPSVTVSSVSNSTVAHAMQGSILSAGLPDGPSIPTLPDPPAPKNVTRFGQLGPNPAREQGLSLQDPLIDPTPAIQAAEAAANSRAANATEPDNTDSTSKPASHIAFRAATPDSKSKQ
jgi:hypothetical protein